MCVVDCVDCGAPVTAAAVRGFAKEVEAGAHTGIMAPASEYPQAAFEPSAERGVFLLNWESVNRDP